MDPGLGQQIVSAGLYNLPRACPEQFNICIQAMGKKGRRGTKNASLAPGDSFIDQMATDATAPFLVGGGAGVGAVKLIANALQMFKALTFAATESIVTKELMPSDAEPFFVGEEAAFPVFDGKEIDPSFSRVGASIQQKAKPFKRYCSYYSGRRGCRKSYWLLF